jgi:hypothetical protein
MYREFPDHFILKIIKFLYNIPETGTYWFGIYYNHYKEKLVIETLTYNPCLLITKNQGRPFGIIDIQTNNILILGDN